ncbi:MAG: CDP-diacylglycerol--glycerol-3-phosphate 3-phosphatidyltransferase [Gammaproteobacteria bacterium]|nr:MAG: CDP-diacylglycerol--glycerol-3-phosphate 3-phosphatidyltransferase [Gammaproteobacteria bacterium]
MHWNIPNILTTTRIVLIPFLMISFLALPAPWSNWISFAIFWIAAVTDWLDGYLARKLNQASAFGAFLDPVADKLMVAVALICILIQTPTAYFAIPVAIIIGREITISALREWMAELGKRNKVAVSILGKVKTVVQMLSIMFLLFNYQFFFLTKEHVYSIGIALLYIAAILTILSMFSYLKAAFTSEENKSDMQAEFE